MTRLPIIEKKRKVCVICEGFEDFYYFKRLIDLGVWSKVYEFVPINAKGASKIFARYQDAYSSDRYEVVLVFCDTDKSPYEAYKPVKSKINSFHGCKDAAAKVIMYANPCTMQITLSHFDDVLLTKQSKKVNADIIEKITGVKGYDAHEDQILAICNKVFKRTYPDMKNRIRKINRGDIISASTNFIDFVDRFESDDYGWIQEINNYLET